jgi:hypothetical protein
MLKNETVISVGYKVSSFIFELMGRSRTLLHLSRVDP